MPSRGLIGFRSQFLTETRGTGLLNTLFDGWEPYAGPMLRRQNGALVSDRTGVHAVRAVSPPAARRLFVGPGDDVYEGMIVGEHNRPNDLDVNVCREKKLTNVRKQEQGRERHARRRRVRSPSRPRIEFIDRDELVEVTPGRDPRPQEDAGRQPAPQAQRRTRGALIIGGVTRPSRPSS